MYARRLLSIFGAILILLMMAGCAAGPNELANSEDDEGEVAGFWRGLWHGIIAPKVRSGPTPRWRPSRRMVRRF